MFKAIQFALLSSILISYPAAAESCATALDGTKASNANFTLTSLGVDGKVDYAKGQVSFSPPFSVKGPKGSFPRPQTWRSPTNLPGRLYPDAGEGFATGLKTGPFVENRISVVVSGLVMPSVTISYLDQGKIFKFSATCSSSRILYGSNGGRDFLIRLEPVIPTL